MGLNPNEKLVRKRIQMVLDNLAPGKFICRERKGRGKSTLGRPVDLEISPRVRKNMPLVSIEVAAVNSTQLLSEVIRLFYDSVPRKLLVLKGKLPGRRGKAICERLICLQYGQEDIRYTPARVVRYANEKEIRKYLKTLLLLNKW